ncbi:ATP-binding cassette domain-containing protein [Arthrobacter sp. NtRootA1]|uniref:ATP-binding cassette domain-containing protein n=1 Tax=Arthrobacter sp. NtRootA1 TaxID=2830983 RepID=UPI001CC7EA22|nr:ATP-binding cassette domain-containing protein [Arthrobacter sp. NtRootA1]BCW05717.1 ABC transporter ATP-binding protein [Arthrobacter sp. NtRootA1]
MKDTSYPVLVAENITVRYRKGRQHFTALDNVNVRIPHAATVGLVGESGSGKSTLAKAILGLVPITTGRIELLGQDITHLNGRRRRGLGRSIQAVFQDPNTSLNPSFTVGRSLIEPLKAQNMLGDIDVDARVAEVLTAVGMEPDAASRQPRQFSGGQRQRISIARALITNPQVVVCDEAVSALDLSVQAQVLNLLTDLQRERGLSYLFISHDMSVVKHICHEVTVLYRGTIKESGPTQQITTQPADPYTKALLLAAPIADPVVQRQRQRPTSAVPAPSRTSLIS